MMPKNMYQLFATDKDIYDLLESGKQKVTVSFLRKVSAQRGIFFSNHLDREEIIDRVSALPHDYKAVSELISHRESSSKREKTTSVTLEDEIPMDVIAEVVNKYATENSQTEDVSSSKKGASGYEMHVGYSEFDLSRTRLIQKQPKEASLEFTVKNGKTVIRMPANEKSRAISARLQGFIKEKIGKEIDAKEIDISGIGSAKRKTEFFLRLIRELQDYDLETVTNLKVAFSGSDEGHEDDLDADEQEEVEGTMMNLVESVALKGQNLQVSKEFDRLSADGYFITSITWHSKDSKPPYDLVKFDVSFENPQEGRGFRYNARYSARKQDGSYNVTFKAVENPEREQIFQKIEATAQMIIAQLLTDEQHEE
jgi:hypothetical protein